MTIKINLEKAYDRLSWECIRDTLQKVGLNHEWVRNIMTCIESPRLAVLWNGEKLDWFSLVTASAKATQSPHIFLSYGT